MMLSEKVVEGEKVFKEWKCHDPKVGGYIRQELETYCEFVQTNKPRGHFFGGRSSQSYRGEIETDNSPIYVEFSEIRGIAGCDNANIFSGTNAVLKYFGNADEQSDDLKKVSSVLDGCFARGRKG